MNISAEALQAPTKDSLDAWLNTPRLAKCGEVFTPAEPMWKPDKSTDNSVNWEAAIACVSPDWQLWLHAALAYRMADLAAGTAAHAASVLSRAAQAGLDPLNEDRTSAKNGDRANRQIEDVAVCGATATCNLDAPYTCYACGQFQPLLYADHRAVLERLERRREQTIATDKTTGVLWDRAILACRKVILDCEAMRRSSDSRRTEE